MARRVRGVLTVEDEQTGDGRVIAPGATTWIDPPLPIAWLVDGDQHVDLVEVAPTVGVVQTITRTGNEIAFTGEVDDQLEEGAEMVRRMTDGTATHGSRFGLSIDPDDWAVEIIATDPAEEEAVLLVASGAGLLPATGALVAAAASAGRTLGEAWAAGMAAGIDRGTARVVAGARAVVAAAGDPDPGDDGGDGVILFADDSGSIIERYTRLRIRGVTACAVPAFAGAYMEMDDAEVVAEPAPEPAGEAVAASGPALVRGLFPPNPPAEWFEPVTDEPDGSLNIVARGSDAGRVSGYIAAWDTCHTGYADRCVPPPREVDYTPFHTGSVELDDGSLIACGVFTWGIPHAGLDASMVAAQDHYGHSDAMFSRVCVGANEHGIWHAGALRASLTADDVSDLQALSMSGDWRWSQQSGSLRLIAALAVNFPGFNVARRSPMAASGRVATLDQLAASVYVDGDRITAMTSAGVLAPAAAEGHSDCGCGGAVTAAGPSNGEVMAMLRKIDLRTRHLVPDAAAYGAARILG